MRQVYRSVPEMHVGVTCLKNGMLWRLILKYTIQDTKRI